MTDIDTLIEFLRPSNQRPGALYKQLAKAFEEAINQGLLTEGDCLIPERDLATRLDVSRVTVRKAILDLVTKGRLMQRQGAGTIVCEQPDTVLHKNLSSLNGFTDEMKKRGLDPKSKLISRKERKVTAQEALMLKLESTDLVCQLNRVRLLNNTPMAFETALIPASIIPKSMDINTSLYVTLAEQNMVPIRATQSIRAVNASAKIATQLDINDGDAVLFMERQGFSEDGRVVEYTQSYYRGDRYDYTVELQ